MSDATKETMEAAIKAHLCDEIGHTAMLTGYILQTSAVSAEGEEMGRDHVMYTGKTGQPAVVTLGLLGFIQYNTEGLVFGGDDDDD